MSSKQYTTEFVIKGDSTSGVKATRELQQANADMTREMQRAQRQSEEMTASFESVSAHAQRLATVSAATTAAMGAMAVAQTHNVAEQAALARSVGVTVQTLQQWEFAAQSVNLGAGKMGDIFKDTSEKIGDFVATGGGEAADLFERLNLDIDTLMGMRPDQQLLAIGEALDGVATQGEKIFFMESLANDASRLLPLLENNAAALRDQISLADQLGVALPQSDIDSIEQAAQKLNELTALGTAFANSVAAEWAPSFIAVSDGAQELIQWLGGMGEVVELVTDGAGLLSGVLAGRLVGALAASGAATVKKISADRAAAAQAAVVAQRERQVALETARRAEAEQVAAQNSARVAAQRAQAAEVEAASKLREIQTTQQLMAAERALEVQRLQAQITATGRQQSLTRLAEIRRTEQGLMAQATAQQQALHAAQQQTLISAQALATAQERAGRAATATNAAYAASTAAANTAATAHTALAGAMRIGRAAMAPLGGPLGVATLAASAFFLFRDSSDEVSASLMDLDQPLEQTIESFREMTREAQQAALVEWGRQQEEEAEKARAALGDIRQEIAKLGGASIFGGRDETQYENYRRLLGEINKVEEGGRRLADVLEEAQGYMDIPPDMLDKLKLLARDFSNGTVNADELGDRIRVLTADMNATADAAENTGQAVNNGAPSATTLDAWAKYNDRLRESIAATRDGGSAMGAANRALDGMGDDVTNIMRGYSIFLTVQDEALKDQRKAQQEAAAEARRAAEEAERNAQRQAQAAQQSAEAQAKALVGIQQEMTPLLKDHADYVERLGVLDKALADGTISEEDYGEAVRWSAEQYRRAATGAEEYEKQTQTLVSTYDRHNQKAQQLQTALEQINKRYEAGEIGGAQYARMIATIRDEMRELALEGNETAAAISATWDRMYERLDDAGVDFWRGWLDGTSNAADQFKGILFDAIAEVQHALITRPLTVGLSTDLKGMMGIGGQSSGGGFSNTIGAAKNLFGAGSKLLGFGAPAAAPSLAMQGGLSSAALASAGQVAGGATYGGWAGSAASGAALGNSAGLASSIASGISTAMPWIAGGLAIDSLLGGGITKAIGGLFGSKSRGPSFDLMTTHQDPNTIFEDVQHGVTATGAFGNVGFHGGNTNRLEETFGSFDNARQLLEGIAATDDMFAALKPDDVEAMTYAIQQMRIQSSDAAGITEQLGDRTKAAVSAMSGDFGAFIKTLEGGAEQIVAQAQNARQAHDLLTGASERMGVQFNATGGYSYEVANGMAAMAGGVQSLETMYSSFYQNYYTEAERTAQKTKDVTAAFAALGFAMPENAAQFRELVLAQDTSTEAGREAQVELLKLEGAFKEVAGSAGDAADASQLAAQRQRLNAQILRLQGDETAALTLERELELQGMDSSLHGLKERVWALEDEKEAQKEAERAQQERIRTIEQEANAWQRAREQLASFGTGIASYIDGLQSTDKGLASPGDQLAAASAAFDEQYAKAASGDRAAMSSITQYADRFIEAQKGWSASGAQTVGTIDRVTGMLEKLPEMLSPEQFLADEFKGIIGEQTVTLAGAFDTGFGNAVDSLSRNFDQIDSNLDGLLTFSEIKRALGDKATDAQISALIAAVDTNGDGMISQQELANAKLGGLASGVAQSLAGSFDSLDANVDGLLTFGELKQGLGGLATDAQIRAMMNSMDLNNDGVINKLESVVIESMPNDARLTNVLRNQMQALGSKTLTSAQVKQALSPIATDAEINRLIKEVDANGDGIITAEELTAKRVSGIAGGVAASLSSSFAMLDKNLDDNLTFGELQSGLKGMATNAQIRAMMNSMDLNNDDVINKLESVVIESMPGDTRLTNVLRNQMQDLRTKTLTAQQVRAALSPIATDSEIDRLIKRVDINGDGVISAEENTAARVAGLADGIAGSLGPMFNSIDFDASGLIDYDEFGKQFKGMASDAELRKIFEAIDANGDGTISELEAVNASTKNIADPNTEGMRVSIGRHHNPSGLIDMAYNWGTKWASMGASAFSGAGGGELDYSKPSSGSSSSTGGASSSSGGSSASGGSSSGGSSSSGSSVPPGAQSLINQAIRLDSSVNGSVENIRTLYERGWLKKSSTTYAAGKVLEALEEKGANLPRNFDNLSSWGFFANGGYTGAGGVNEPAGIVHKGEVVWSQADIARAGGVSAVESMRKLGAGGLLPVPSRDLPMPDIAAFPLLNRNDQNDVVRDMQRQIDRQNKEIIRLLKAMEQHTGAAVQVQQAGFSGQISEQKKGNAALGTMASKARLEGSR
ncbi:EF-hand domain-containing protein [Stutzerimonas xanthomarina]|uniref:EF-hand domain-containing protein n=1 Tax=Stutzerimonas xanthomarina TaxID=271420 RepID=UPI003AA9BB8A